MAAFCTKLVALEVDCDCSLLRLATTALGAKRKARPPAGHGIGLRERAEDDDVLLGPGEGAAGDRLAGIVQIDVALVQKQENAALMGEAHDALQVFGGDDRAGRVRGRVEDDGLGPGRDGLLDGVGGDAEALRLLRLEEDDLAAGVLDDVFEADPVGNGQDDFVAVIDEDLDGVEEGQLAAGGEDGLVDGVVGAEVAGMALDDGLAHVGDAGDDRVAREVGLDGGDGRVLDVARGGEVRLAGAEIHQVGALGAQLGGLRGHGHGCGDLDPADAAGKDLGRSGDCHSNFYLDRFLGWGKILR